MPARMKLDISVIIPIYNGSQFIDTTVRAYYDALQKDPYVGKFEIILVTNNCSDDSPQRAGKWAQKQKRIRHMDFPFKTLKGGAVIRGFEKSRYPFVGFTDVDMSTSPNEFVKLIPYLFEKHVGAVIASRKMPNSFLHPPQSFLRQFLGDGFGLIRELLFGLGIKDSQCGAKIFRREAIVPLKLKTTGWAFDVELLYKVKRNGFVIKEIGITWKDKPGSVLRLTDPFYMLKELIRLRLRV
ncbi:MAG: glycosyltransferase [Candidatus Diapherotrites archaeon]